MFVDERALVLGAKKLGFVFTTRTPEYIAIKVVSILSTLFVCSLTFRSLNLSFVLEGKRKSSNIH